jgi:hypothetical protein
MGAAVGGRVSHEGRTQAMPACLASSGVAGSGSGVRCSDADVGQRAAIRNRAIDVQSKHAKSASPSVRFRATSLLAVVRRGMALSASDLAWLVERKEGPR